MSCLPSDALSHFEQREQELLALNAELEKKRAHAVEQASTAVRDAESSSLHSRALRPTEDAAPPEKGASRPLTDASDATPLLEAAAAAVPSASRPSSSSMAGGPGDGEALHTTIRFQNARIMALQEELDKSIAELSSKDSEVQVLKQENKQVTEELKRLQKMGALAEQSQEKLKKSFAAVESKCKDLETERSELLKERDQLDLKLRKSEAENSSKEARINRLTEDCEKHKAAAKDASHQDRDRASTDRRETDRLTSEVRKLERQRSELVAAFKKQMKLIEVLKRQRAHMEAARVLSFTEDEFIRILELGDKLGE
eukprot:CAMPEP_0197661922 /NCGR_PEP_ID=MMETSP1338-20131121/51752_1 /TAXON_ID=43686 ORGANISM="Pelagodinium beii, Strain RCC1491" /NCGR_SAMPLE_ID=MMETSP1338 /ASSEMBLY_ACC=CAM_ASM_000754 /LENGTH=313 /DNA_ID=CAMNT_0043239573 /DNA_START=25 /DNA_END=966 /DNA_ORIENTATION=-